MASILKRGDSYSVRYKYKDHSGKPCEGWESFKTKKEAQERKITVEKELLDGTFLVPDAMTVEEMLYKWIPIQSTKHKWSPKTYTQSVGGQFRVEVEGDQFRAIVTLPKSERNL